jgi:hypothetical protein
VRSGWCDWVCVFGFLMEVSTDGEPHVLCVVYFVRVVNITVFFTINIKTTHCGITPSRVMRCVYAVS